MSSRRRGGDGGGGRKKSEGGGRRSHSSRHRGDERERREVRKSEKRGERGEEKGGGGSGKSRIAVCVRKRPMNRGEEGRGERDIVSVLESESVVVVHEPKVKVDMTKYIEDHEYRFDEVFYEGSTNAEVYARTARPLVSTMFAGGRATCFAYGQTGSGKTYTMSGMNNDGLYSLAAQDIFDELGPRGDRADTEYSIWISFFEIYGGVLYDLLNDRKKLVAREDAKRKVCIVGLNENLVSSVDEFLELMSYGNAVRSTGATGVNADSSRSHAILQIVLKKDAREEPYGKLSFIDLAGSERAADTTNNDRRRRMEGAEINKSLLALKECIRALDMEKVHTPFRQSKLTQVLKDSFVGKSSRTVMIATVSPTNFAAENTLNTLRYADRVKELRSKGSGGGGGGAPPSSSSASSAVSSSSAASGAPSSGQRGRRAVAGGRGAVSRTAAPRGGGMTPDRRGRDGGRDGRGGRADERGGRSHSGGGGGGGGVKDVEELVDDHADLVSQILQEKEDLILAHRQQIDDMMEVVKQEMKLLHSVDQPGSVVDEYVSNLDDLLESKMRIIRALSGRLARFKDQLEREETLSKSLEKSLPFPSDRSNRGGGGSNRRR